MRLFVTTLLICLGFSLQASAKNAKSAAKTGGHLTYPRTLIYSPIGVKGQPAIVLPKDALAGVAINAPLLTLEKTKGAEGENVEVETTQLKASNVKLAPATATDQEVLRVAQDDGGR